MGARIVPCSGYGPARARNSSKLTWWRLGSTAVPLDSRDLRLSALAGGVKESSGR